MKVVIVGGVAGGASVATRLRRLDETMQITIFEKGNYISYANCGLPYHLSGKIAKRNALLLQTPENMKNTYNVDVKVNSEVINIDTEHKMVTVEDSEKTYQEPYDVLVMATGARGRNIDFEGSENFVNKAFLKDIHDLDKVKSFMEATKYKKALIIGSGFIGVEVAENLIEAGYAVDMVELMPKPFSLVDDEFSGYVGRYLNEKGVNLYTETKVDAYCQENDTVTLSNGKEGQYDFIVQSAGLLPNSEIAKEVGVKLNERGYIMVNDESYETSVSDIFAVGDVIETKDFLTGDHKTIPLAWGAKRQARILADYIATRYENKTITKQVNKGGLGTSIIKIFDMTLGFVGMTEKEALRRGIDYDKIMIHGSNHVSYYPGGSALTIKVVYEKATGKLLGGQILGKQGVDKRIDVLVTAITFGATVYDLSKLELAYAPPYNGPKDPLNIIGYIAANIKDGLNRYVTVENLEERLTNGAVLLDVRNPGEVEEFAYPGAINIPLPQLRQKMNELEKNQEIIVTCKVAQRAYNAMRMLENSGFTNVYNLMGGMDSIRFFK
ncbi:MAG: FAD-dependent oxidoreductase [Cellulosilyticaceae bacterium]